MSDPPINHLSCLRSAKGAMTKVAKDIAALVTIDCERIDSNRLSRVTDALHRANESFELHLDALRDTSDHPETPYDVQLDDHLALFQKHSETLTGLKDKREALVLMSQLSLAIQRLETRCSAGYSPVLNYDMDHAASLSHRAMEAQATPAVRDCPHMLQEGERQVERLQALQQRRADQAAAAAIPTISARAAPMPIFKTSSLKLDLPVFNGRIEKWHSFWALMTSLLEQHPELTEQAKQAHIIKQMGTPECQAKAESAFELCPDYESAVERLRSEYEKPRLLLGYYVKTLTNLEKYHNKRSEILEMADTVEGCVAGMKRLKSFTASQIVSTIAVTYMDNDLLTQWGKATESRTEPPGVEYLLTFLRRHATSVPEDMKVERTRPKKSIKTERSVMRLNERDDTRRERSPSPTSSTTTTTAKCICCHDSHNVYSCPQFRRMSCPERKDLSKQLELCYNCLNPNHRATDCRSRNTCRVCSGHHHTLLHEDRPPTANKTNIVESCVNVTNGRSIVTTHCSIPRTALVEVSSPQAKMFGRLQMDSGAEVSLITRRFATQLKAKRIPNSSSTITGVEGSFVSPHQVSLTLKGRKGELMDVNFHLVDRLAVSSSTVDMHEVREMPFLRNLDLADSDYGTNSRVDMLLDMSSSLRCSEDQLRRSGNKQLRAEQTIFGWTVGGRHNCAIRSKHPHPHILKVVAVPNQLDESLQQLWEREEFPTDADPISTQDELAMQQFQETLKREPDGTYSVSLPRKMPPVKLGESRVMALKRTLSTEKSHKRRGDGDRYQKAAAEYAELGHAERVPPSELEISCEKYFYLPIHSVIKPSSSSTKFRLVFDASAKSSNGVALNDVLLPGPSVCSSLATTLIRFRTHKLGMTSDIKKMFRGVRLNPPDRDYHRFYLRNDQGEMETWRMNRVTFGVTSSPFLATQVLREIAEEYQSEFPRAARAIRESFYVDDCLVGADDLESARQLREDVNTILSRANMVICKWRTSSPDLTNTIPEHLRESEAVEAVDPILCSKTLGIHWDNVRDNFHITTPPISTSVQPTKKDLLSAIARVYDLLGWYAPAILSAKLLMQETWKLELSWDQPLPEPLRTQMLEWCSQLHLLTENPIPRCYYSKDLEPKTVEVHSFADASTKGYGGVVYVRVVYSNSVVFVSLVMSRGKVVPVRKPPSIPRLELCAAVMTARMTQYVRTILNINPTATYCWSDSTAVLGWINQDVSRLEVYVGNRVRKLTEYTDPGVWRYVNTGENPADCLSRGVLPQALISHKLWWNGPEWLRLDPRDWPRHPDINLSRELTETTAIVNQITITEPEIGHKRDTFSRLTRLMAWVQRFIKNSRMNVNLPTCSFSLSLQELREARLSVLRHSQHVHYSRERSLLEDGRTLPARSRLADLSPFLDGDSILRVGGRLQKANLSYDATHPIILSSHSHTTLLLLRQMHLDTVHAGPQTMLALVSQTYRISGVKRVLRRISRECFTCRESNAKIAQQMMGELPKERVTPSRPFSTVGVDYAGPFNIKTGSVRRPTINKAYICVFICYATRAVHLEVVSELTTEAFLAALTRFVGRRGYPTDIHSDNGSNFIGAVNEFQEIQTLLRAQETQETISLWAAPKLIHWHFNPARAPHFGGLWEAAVGAMKKTLRKTMQDTRLNFEELSTVVIQVEAMLNSRPMVPTDSLPDESIPLLTAGHFLIGAPLASMPSLVDSTSKICLVRRWNLTQRLAYDLWNRWSTEYLSQLQRRCKWQKQNRQVQVGDLVLVRDESTFSRQWPKGRVSKVYPGADQLVRAVDVKTSNGTFRRPISKLCVLIEASEDKPPTGEYVRASSQTEILNASSVQVSRPKEQVNNL